MKYKTLKNIAIPVVAILLLIGIFVVMSAYEKSINKEIEEVKIIKNAPSFEDFSIADIYTDEKKAPDFSTDRGSLTFKTVIEEGLRGGPNFAGHYSIVSIGCGTMCQTYKIVDLKTGKIFSPSFASSEGVSYRLGSNLIITNPEGVDSDPVFYIWDNDRLVFVAKQYKEKDALICTTAIKLFAEGEDSIIKEFEPCELPSGYKVDSIEDDATVNFINTGSVALVDGTKFFVYEKLGESKLNKTLTFNSGSKCFSGIEGEVGCSLVSISSGDRVYIEGFESEESVTVWLLINRK